MGYAQQLQVRYASVFAITAGAFVPLCFGAVRMAENLTHPQAGTMTTRFDVYDVATQALRSPQVRQAPTPAATG